MKYPYWNEYDNAKKWKAVEAELALETNNATTKADLTNMVKFLGQEAARLQAAVYKAEAEVTKWQDVAEQRLENALVVAQKVCRLEAENAKLRSVADIAWNVVETKGLSDVLLNELAGRLADWETWKEGER